MIGIFDSGVGGVSVLRALRAHLPGYDMVFFGDTAGGPYETKSADRVRTAAAAGLARLMALGPKILVIACHATAAVAWSNPAPMDATPRFDALSTALKKAVSVTRNGRIGLIAGDRTIRSGAPEAILRQHAEGTRIFSSACPLLPPLVAANRAGTPEARMILKKCLYPLKVRQVDTLVWADNHLPAVAKWVTVKMGRRIRIVDPAAETAAAVKAWLETHPEAAQGLPQNGRLDVLVTDYTRQLAETAQRLFGRRITLDPAAHVPDASGAL